MQTLASATASRSFTAPFVCSRSEQTARLSSDFKTYDFQRGSLKRAGNRSPHDLEGLGTKTRHIEIFVFSDANDVACGCFAFICHVPLTRPAL